MDQSPEIFALPKLAALGAPRAQQHIHKRKLAKQLTSKAQLEDAQAKQEHFYHLSMMNLEQSGAMQVYKTEWCGSHRRNYNCRNIGSDGKY